MEVLIISIRSDHMQQKQCMHAYIRMYVCLWIVTWPSYYKYNYAHTYVSSIHAVSSARSVYETAANREGNDYQGLPLQMADIT